MIDSDVAVLSPLRDAAHQLSDPDPHDAPGSTRGCREMPRREGPGGPLQPRRSGLDVTRAVEPLERMPLWEAGEPAETYPTGL